MERDKRDKLWATIEKEIQRRAYKKDFKFKLEGKWKKFIRKQNGFKIFSVDGTWIRDNLSVTFAHGGHGFVHEFIPKDEIWVSSHHYNEGKSELARCSCITKKKKKAVSTNYFDSSVIHEIFEFKKMKKKVSYWKAHQSAIEKEKQVGLLKDAFIDD